MLPRLAELARGPELPEAAGSSVVVIAPIRRQASTEAAAAVAGLLGVSPENGRLRLAVTYPEPLMLLDQDGASDALRVLREAGVEAFEVPAEEVRGAARVFEVERVEADETGWTFRSRDGGSRRLERGAPRFVARGQRLTVRDEDRRRSEPTAYVFQPNGDPLVLTPFSLRSGPVGTTPPQRLDALVDALAAPPGRAATIPGCSAPALLSSAGEGVRSNVRSLALAARLLRFREEQDSLG